MNSQPSPPPPPRILVVDDDGDIRQRYLNVLMQAGYRVDTTEDDDAGWEVLRTARHDPDAYHLLITNNEMPKLYGTRSFNKYHSTKKTLLIIPASEAVTADAGRLRLVAILPKPVASHELVQRVNAVLQETAGKRHCRTGACDRTSGGTVWQGSEKHAHPGAMTRMG
jgi:DNA-binding response OmpR family regulator